MTPYTEIAKSISDICQKYDIDGEMNLSLSSVHIKKCANCGKYFCPNKRSDTKYCDRVSPQNPNKICKEYGKIRAAQDNLKNNKIESLNKRIYNILRSRVKRQEENNSPFPKYARQLEEYKKERKQWKSDIKDGKKSETEYFEYLKKFELK